MENKIRQWLKYNTLDVWREPVVAGFIKSTNPYKEYSIKVLEKEIQKMNYGFFIDEYKGTVWVKIYTKVAYA
jgi:hypothetical protein